ncbi:MAG TPA: hypothetical protein VM118_03185, partial [Acidobacteriota bacterium]|nr:hypothetical protein [Acidobacteriota bacterium]
MKIPRKDELLRLQELYKTDARIAEALGGIPEYLVAYWRRKKNIPRHSSVKFSPQQITELWERFGDDFRCGRELNISKGAFYSWRRKYGITERPAVLKLEQLELRLDKEVTPEQAIHSPEPKTAFAKIWKRCRSAWPEADRPADWVIASRDDAPGAPLVVSPGPTLQPPPTDPEFNPVELIPPGAAEAVWCYREHGSVVCQLVESRVVLPGQLVRGPRGLLGGL